ncbi:hypothetical protein [Metabacillus endolithicus]|uniref:Uncharacterized protein n=1 Tax=Metabacillus endolithicus TaxID=1535204 RepID=A0ABW5C2J7_9BACI|nr:hypothetical protein [Metabacillus endolithicus]UPG65055.1 hypothetical protein MVE64_08675 [Metabacillus endolithicus]
MKALVVKKYFLDINEREQLEREFIKQNPDFIEHVLEWDDEELLERLNIDRKNLV